MLAPWKKSYDKPRQCIKKQRHHFVNKGLYSQSYCFPSSHVQMWELDHKEIWAPKNWCFQTVEAGEDSRESLGQQENQTSQSSRKIVLNIHWKDWCWSWSSNTLATWCKEPAHWKWPRWWERFEARKGHQRMRWLDSIIDSMHMSLSKLKRQWRTGKPDMLQSVGLQSWTRLSNCTTW